MIIEVRSGGIKLVSPDLNEVYKISYVIAGGLQSLMDDSNIELRQKLVKEYGDGEKVYIMIYDKTTPTHIHVSTVDSKPPYMPQRKSTVDSGSDVKILYKKEVTSDEQ